MDLHFDFAYSTRRKVALFLTSNMLVNKHSDLLAVDFLTILLVILKLGLTSVTYSGVKTIAASIISLRFCWSSHLLACWYIFFVLFKYLCSTEGLLLNDWSIPVVFTWFSRRGYYNMALSTTHCWSNSSIERIQSMSLFIILDLTHWAAWEDFSLIWKHK